MNNNNNKSNNNNNPKTEYEKARNYCIYLLARAAKSRKQLMDMMLAKQYSQNAIDEVIKLLSSKGYIDDIAFAKSYISSKTRAGNHGKKRIVIALMQKGVAKEDIIMAYNQLFEENRIGEEESELINAKKALEKKLANKDPELLKDPKQKRRIMEFLMRRGFSYDVVKKALGDMAQI